jgi:hypothetical protein
MTDDLDDRDEPIEAEAAPPGALEARRAGLVPRTLDDLAALAGTGALENIRAREVVLTTARFAILRMAAPEHMVLFKAPDAQITAYLSDHACEGARNMLGIEIYNQSRPEKLLGDEPGEFHYVVTGDGRCKLTGQTIERVEGGRSSTDDFCKGKHGLALELDVRKAAVANLIGRIVRSLGALNEVPTRDLETAWAGTNKSVDQCRRGKGFGSRNERLGAAPEKGPNLDPPICPHCQSRGLYRPAKGDRKPFYGCPNYAKHPEKKFIVDVEAWQRQHAAAAPKNGAPAAAPAPGAAPPMPTADEIFGGGHGREPGEEG